MSQVERRVSEPEARIVTVETGLTEAQRLTVERYVGCLLRGIPIPPRLRAARKDLPKEDPPSFALQRMIDDVKGGTRSR